jgi:hypothetical protein
MFFCRFDYHMFEVLYSFVTYLLTPLVLYLTSVKDAVSGSENIVSNGRIVSKQ